MLLERGNIDQKATKKGFTLVELLISIAIILILFITAIPQFLKYGSKSELSAKADEIESLIKKAKMLSESPPKGCNGAVLSVNTFASPPTITMSPVLFDSSNNFALCSYTDAVLFPDSPAYMQLVNNLGASGTEFSVYFKSPGSIVYPDTTGFDLTVHSDKADAGKRIIIESPFRVMTTDDD